jgi:hypothetical protein
MKSVVDRRREGKIELYTTTDNGFLNPSCGCARADGENFELQLGVLDPAYFRRDECF